MAEYVAIRECFIGGVLYRKGQHASFLDGEAVPHHFEPLAPPVDECPVVETPAPAEAPALAPTNSRIAAMNAAKAAKRAARLSSEKIA